MKRSYLIPFILVYYILSLLGTLESVEIRGPEPKRAVVSIEMFLSDNLIVPTIHGEPYYNKPPVFNWVQVFFFNIFNSYDERICRIPGLLSLLLTGIMVYLLGRSLFDKKTGTFAALIFLTFSHLYYYGAVRAGSLDLFLSLLIFIQTGSIIYFSYKQKYLLLFVVSYAFAAIGFLTKGLPSMLSQIISLLTIFIYFKNFRKLFNYKHLIGVILFVLIVGSYLFIYSKNGNIRLLIFNMLSESTKRFDDATGIWSYLKNITLVPYRSLMTVMLPWSLVLLFLFKKKIREKLSESKQLSALAWLASANIIIYLVASDYSPRYIYPFLPFTALIFAKILKDSLNSDNMKILSYASAIILLPVSVLLLFLPFIPYFEIIDYLILKILVFSTVLLILSLLYFRRKLNFFYGIIIFLITLRFFTNYIYLPAFQNDEFSYKKTSEELLMFGTNTEIYLTGSPDIFPLSLGTGNGRIQKSRDMIVVPPAIPDQITFYYTKSTGQVFQYKPYPQKGDLCLARRSSLPACEIEEFMSFNDHFVGHELVLFRIMEDQFFAGELPEKIGSN